jgi:dTDP-4-dehydrorhamnose reductase
VNAYGRTKLAGDLAIQQAGGDHLIFRTSWVFAAEGQNFVRTMLRLGDAREQLSVVADQHGAPTYASHLAAASLAALERALAEPRFPSGVYHLAGTGDTTWHEFACAIFAEARQRGVSLKVREVRAIATADYPVPARRPLNSRLDTSLAERTFGVRLPPWRDGLIDLFDTMGRTSGPASAAPSPSRR